MEVLGLLLVLFVLCYIYFLSPTGRAGDYKTHSVHVCMCYGVCVTLLLRAVHHTGCLSLAFSIFFFDLIAYVLSFDAVISHLGP